MPRRVLIVGCGYVGLAAGAELVRQGHEVWGLRRSSAANAELRDVGIVPLNADITVPATLPKAGARFDWVVNCLSGSGGGVAEYRQTYLEGARHLLSWLAAAPPAQLVYTSSTSVYGQTDGSVVDETSPTHPRSSTGPILLETEQLLLHATNLPAAVLRVGAIYGPGRAYWLERFEAGQASLEGDGSRILNMIHREDLAGAIIAALARGKPGQVYNAVDDEPVRQSDLLEWLSKRLARTLPPPGTGQVCATKRGVTSKKVCNRKLKEELGYQFRFPTFRQGFEQILQAKEAARLPR